MAAGRCSGIVLFSRNVQDPRQVLEIARRASAARGGAIPVAVDQEGGRIARLRGAHFTMFPPARTMARHAPGRIERGGRAMAEEMAACGINLDFAPVLDVQASTDGVIGDRAFGADPESAARCGLAWLRGLESAGVAGCVKHFPGHGDASCDSHVDLPLSHGGLEGIRCRHLTPFRAACNAGVRAVMVAHLLVPELDPERPASLCPGAVDGLLRAELGFDGVAVTDDLEMGAVTLGHSVAEAAVLAVEAGCDALLVCKSRERQDEAEEALALEAEASQEFRSMIERSAGRIEALRCTLAPPPETFDPSRLRTEDHLAIARELAA